MSSSRYVCCSILIISILINSGSFLSLSLTSVSNLNFFPVSVVVCNHLSASVLKLLNWL